MTDQREPTGQQREPTGQQVTPADVLVRELEATARHGRTAWKVAAGVGGVLVTIASLLFFLARQSFEAGREAQRLAGEVVTREQARNLVKEATDPLAHRLDAINARCSKHKNCCTDITRTNEWVDWGTECLDKMSDKVRVRCGPRPRFTLSNPINDIEVEP